ncbi:hypothetical protein LIER_11787 [Lithospermum erythrorhizon]|uniref:Uncharacterized protein n=1 Tax=Lithospermum erythrorhizon TaxID=34254 RepID=A0AAV3PQR8_LITER
MTGNHRPLFRWVSVKKVSTAPTTNPSHSTVTPHSSSASGKRPAVEIRPPLFSKRQKSIAHKRPMSEILDLTEDPPTSSPQEVEVPREDSGLHPSTLEPPTKTPVDSAPQVTTGYSMNFLELPYTVPGGF